MAIKADYGAVVKLWDELEIDLSEDSSTGPCLWIPFLQVHQATMWICFLEI
jgi:hypothetical protein